MASEYTHRLTVCAPLAELHAANQLACIVGESAADIETFTVATHTRDGVEYACVSTVVKDVFAEYLTGGLPDPPHAAEAERAAAERAFAGLNQPDGIVFELEPAEGSSAVATLDRLGFIAIEEEEAIDETETDY